METLVPAKRRKVERAPNPKRCKVENKDDEDINEFFDKQSIKVNSKIYMPRQAPTAFSRFRTLAMACTRTVTSTSVTLTPPSCPYTPTVTPSSLVVLTPPSSPCTQAVTSSSSLVLLTPPSSPCIQAVTSTSLAAPSSPCTPTVTSATNTLTTPSTTPPRLLKCKSASDFSGSGQ